MRLIAALLLSLILQTSAAVHYPAPNAVTISGEGVTVAVVAGDVADPQGVAETRPITVVVEAPPGTSVRVGVGGATGCTAPTDPDAARWTICEGAGAWAATLQTYPVPPPPSCHGLYGARLRVAVSVGGRQLGRGEIQAPVAPAPCLYLPLLAQ